MTLVAGSSVDGDSVQTSLTGPCPKHTNIYRHNHTLTHTALLTLTPTPAWFVFQCFHWCGQAGLCVCVYVFTSSSCLCTHETRTSKRFVPFCFVFQSRLHHNSRLLQADCDSDQQFPDKATAPAALRVYELLMPLFIKLRDTIYHIESHGLQFYI